MRFGLALERVTHLMSFPFDESTFSLISPRKRSEAMDFVMPHPCDPPFIAPTANWRPNSNNYLPMIPDYQGGSCGCTCCHKHASAVLHQSLYANSLGFPSHTTVAPKSSTLPFMNGGVCGVGGGGAGNTYETNRTSPLSLFSWKGGLGSSGSRGERGDGTARSSPFTNSPNVFHNYGNGCGDTMFRMSHKIAIPHHASYNFIGRILGPRGNSVRRLEALTGCKILIRGKGSIKDANKEMRMHNMPGWEHLNEDLHVLITAEDANEHMCQMKLRRASISIQRLLTPQFDEYKRQQLIQLAIINGTYRP